MRKLATAEELFDILAGMRPGQIRHDRLCVKCESEYSASQAQKPRVKSHEKF